MLITLVVSELCFGHSSICKNEQRAITPKLGMAELRFFVHCTSTQWNLSTYKFFCWYLLQFQSYVQDKMWMDRQIDGRMEKATPTCLKLFLPLGSWRGRTCEPGAQTAPCSWCPWSTSPCSPPASRGPLARALGKVYIRLTQCVYHVLHQRVMVFQHALWGRYI